MINELCPEAKLYFRDELRSAVAAAQKDAEGYQEILFTLERLGITLTGEVTNLGIYKDDITSYVRESTLREFLVNQLKQWHLSFGELYDIVKDARNEAFHNGAVARHITRNAIRLALVLEEALMSEATLVREFMVRDPVCAYLWQPVSLAKQQMLVNGFTYLPIYDEISNPPEWKLLADYQIGRYLQVATTKKSRYDLLAKTIGEAIRVRELQLLPAKTCRQDQTVKELVSQVASTPFLVTVNNGDNKTSLIGILAPFDLL